MVTMLPWLGIYIEFLNFGFSVQFFFLQWLLSNIAS